MKCCTALLFVLLSMSATPIAAQPLENHRWQERIVLVMATDPATPAVREQIAAFLKNEKGMRERRLIVYQLSPTQYKQGLARGPWIASKTFFYTYKKSDAPLELILIGLDGEIKLRQNSFLSCDRLFSTIDAMPMRQSELNNRSNRDSTSK